MTALVQWGHSVAHRARRKVRKLSRVCRVVGPDGHLRRLVPLHVGVMVQRLGWIGGLRFCGFWVLGFGFRI